MENDPVILTQGKHLRFMRRGTWEYADRPGITGIVGIIAITDDRKLLLVEQWRPPVNSRVIELPAGLVGDEAGHERESIFMAARRELLEETGYDAEDFSILATGPASAGISSEVITLLRAKDLRKISVGGGIDNEEIIIHEVPLSEVAVRLKEWSTMGRLVDLKVYAAQYFVESAPLC